MENQQLGDTPVPFFPETPVKRNMSKEEIAEVIGMLTEVLENVNLEINKLKTETKDRFESIEKHMMNLVEGHEDVKEWNTKSYDYNERRLIEKENHELKKKILELESSLKQKEQVINSIIESFTYQQQPQPVNRDRWYTEKRKTTPPQNPKQDNIASNNRFDALRLNDVNYEDFTNEDENINVSNPGNQQTLKQQATTIKNTERPPVVTNSFPENNNPAWRSHKPTVPGNAKYSDAVRFGRKMVILGASMIKGMRMKEFNSYVKNGYSKLRPFPGATVKQLQHYAIPSLVDETPNQVILHSGCNDVSNRNASPEQIANDIKVLAEMCRGYGVNKIFVSTLICRKNNYLNENVTRINFSLNLICKEKGFVFKDIRMLI